LNLFLKFGTQSKLGLHDVTGMNTSLCRRDTSKSEVKCTNQKKNYDKVFRRPCTFSKTVPHITAVRHRPT